MIGKLALGMAAAIAIAVTTSGAAHAQVCSRNIIAATGKTSITAVGARISARNAWRATVTRRLGARYASISRARAARTVCRKIGKRTSCRFIARPCRA
ncbi:MAG: hypothetical protein ACK4TL_12255 [Hyphomicrobiaceae bacterium]